MSVSESRSAAKSNVDEHPSRFAGTEPEGAHDALVELARRLAPLHSSPYPQAVSEHGRTDAELTTQPLETAKLPPSNSETSNAPSNTAFADVGTKQAFEFNDPYSCDLKQGRSGGWKLKVSALGLAGLAIIGAVSLKARVPSLPKAASFIAEAQGPAKMRPLSDRTVAPSSDTGAIIPKQGIQEARDEVALPPGQPKGLIAEVSEDSTPSVDFGSATAGPAQPTTGDSSGAPMPTPVSSPGAALPTAAPPATASQFPDLKTERTFSLDPDGISRANATPSATGSGEAARTNGVSRPRAKPGPKAAIETAEIGERSTPKLDLRRRPFTGPPARAVAANVDTAAPSPTQETSSQLVHLGASVNSEKAANALKPPQTAVAPQAPLAPAQPVNPLVRALGDSIGALTARTEGAQRPIDQITTSPSGGWAVQLAAPKSESEAQSDVARLNAKYASALSGATITVHEVQIYGATFYRVRVQGQSKVDAAALCARLKRDGGDCFIAK
jgi:SPOR domain